MGKVLNLKVNQPKLRYRYTEVIELLPETYRKQVTPDESRNRTISYSLIDWCFSQATHFLDQTVANVLHFIIARTYMYYKEGELISVSHFVNGVFKGKDGVSIAAPAVKDRATVYKALSILEETGLIERTRVTVNSADVVSLICVKPEAILSMSMTREGQDMLRISKKQRMADSLEMDAENEENTLKPSSCRVVGKPPTRLEGKPPTEVYEVNRSILSKPSCSVPRNVGRVTRTRNKFAIECNDSALTAIDKAVARVTERRESKVRRAAAPGAGFVSLTDLNAIWQSVMIETFGSCTFSGLTHKEYGIFKRIAKTHTMSCSWREFCLWVVRNWAGINKESRALSAYMKGKTGEWSLKDDSKIFLGTETPDISQMTRNFAKLVKRFSQQSLVGHGVREEDSAEVIELRKEVALTKREASMNRQLLQKALNARSLPATPPKVRRPVTIVDPTKDTFFRDVDCSLPDWK